MQNSKITTLFVTLCLYVCASVLSHAQDDRRAPNQPSRNPIVRVVTITQDRLENMTGEEIVADTLERLNQAASFRPDIACLPEAFTRGEPETVPGPTTDRLAKWAQEHNCYVISPIHTRDGDRLYNSAILIDRNGRIAGQYNKIHPTEGELTKGICPGEIDPPVFDTDFGKIGIQICFDINWGQQWRILKEKGAKIVFFASAYPATRQVRTQAWLNQYFVVSSTKSRTSSIFDVTGEVLAYTGYFQQWAGAVLPLGKTVFEIDFHIGKMREIQNKYGSRVEVTWYNDEDLVTLASLDPELTVEDLIKEYELTPHRDYMRRAQKKQDELRPSKKT